MTSDAQREPLAASAVRAGSQVTVQFGEGVEQTFLLDADPRSNAGSALSSTSPLGRALLGHRVGDHVNYTAPAGEFKVEIVAVT